MAKYFMNGPYKVINTSKFPVAYLDGTLLLVPVQINPDTPTVVSNVDLLYYFRLTLKEMNQSQSLLEHQIVYVWVRAASPLGILTDTRTL